MGLRKLLLIGTSVCLATIISHTAQAQSLVLGDGEANSCYLSVRHGDPGRISTIKTCKNALTSINTSKKDKAATYVNLGILQMRAGHYENAQTNYDKAISMIPDMPEAHINYGAVLIYSGRYKESITAINKAIELGTKKMPEALFNRAMAYDHLRQYDKAYQDLRQALELRPNWLPAVGAIDNYEVVEEPQTN